LRDALQLITRVNGRTLGIVINQVTKADAASGFYGGYYGDYGAPNPPARQVATRRRAKSKSRRPTATKQRSRRR
jgi:hypothetical protein